VRSMTNESETLPGLEDDPRDREHYKAVQELLEEVQPNSQMLKLSKALVSWLAAFSLFKKLERKIGLPISAESKLGYGSIVDQLKASGKWLLLCVGNHPAVLEMLELSYEDVASRVKELSWDNAWVENPTTKEEKSKLLAAFGE